jgi:hypothetical protein
MKQLGNDPLVLLEHDPFAYEALPECYKNDRSLNFFLDANGNLCAEHELHDEEYLWRGEWMRVR